MTPPELQQALFKIPARSAQVLTHRVLEARSRAECAALYGLTPAQWDVLFLRAVQQFERAAGQPRPPPADADEAHEAARIGQQLSPPIIALSTHRDETRRLLAKAQADHEASPAYALEVWARRVAIVVIIALTAYFYWREQQNKKYVPYAPYLTEPKRK